MRTKSGKGLFLQILLIFIITRGIIAGVYFAYCAIFNETGGFEHVFGRWDTEHYMDIVNNGYHLPQRADGMANWAFFPLFPLACRGVMLISGGNLSGFWSGIIVSNVCLFISSYFAVKLIRERGLTKGERGPAFSGLAGNGLLLAWFLMLAPLTIYFAVPYTESMFVMLIVLFFYSAQKELFPLAGIFAALAGATRSVGIVLVIPLIMAMYTSYRDETGSGNIFKYIGSIFARPSRLFSILVVPAGLVGYMLYLYYFLGDILAFVHVQYAWRKEAFVPVVGVLKRYMFSLDEPHYTISAWMCVAVLALYLWMFVKGLRKEAVFGAIALLVPLSSHIMSTPRFISGSFVIWMGLYYAIKEMKSGAAQMISVILLYAGGIITIAMWCAQAGFVM